MIQELPEDQVAPGRHVALDQTEQEILFQPPIAEVPLSDERQGNLLQDYEQRFERLPEDQKLSRLCSEAGLNLVEVGQFCYALPALDEPKTVDQEQRTIRPCLGGFGLQNNWRI